MEPSYDVLVIGSGIAGITAGIYLKRSSFSCAVLDKGAPGGKLNNIHRIDNYPSEPSISGPELAMKLMNQAMELGVPLEYGNVMDVRKEGDGFLVSTDQGAIHCLALIVATGMNNRGTLLPGEQEFLGKGVSYCATCDGPFFRNKSVIAYGDQDHAVEDAIYLSGVASSVTFLAPNPIECTLGHKETLLSKENVAIREGVKIAAIQGDETVRSVLLSDGTSIAADAAFLLTGEMPSAGFLAPLSPSMEKGFLKVDVDMNTSVPGLFAAGDVTKKKLRQLVTASSDGAIAATSAIAYVHSHKKKQ